MDEALEREKKCPAVFFFGAGASVPARVPDTRRFVKYFQNILNNKELDLFKSIKEMLTIYKKEQKREKDDVVDIELVLETLTRIENYEHDPLFWKILPDAGSGILKEVSDLKLSGKLKNFIRENCLVRSEKVDYLRPLRDIVNIYAAYEPINIITTNYDTAIEQFCAFQKLRMEDGFGGIFENERLLRNDVDIRLFKLHGSILWYRSNIGAYYKLPVVSSKIERTAFDEELEPLIIYPMRKWEYVEPTFQITVKAMEIMRSPDINFIYVFGYSFRDEHIRNMFFDIFRERQDVYCVLVDPNAYEIYEKQLKYYDSINYTEYKVLSSMAGKVICKATIIENELENFNNNSLAKIKQALDELYKYEKELSRTGNREKRDEVAASLLEANYLDKFEELRISKAQVIKSDYPKDFVNKATKEFYENIQKDDNKRRRELELCQNGINLMDINSSSKLRLCLIYIANHIIKVDNGRGIYRGLDWLISELNFGLYRCLKEAKVVNEDELYVKFAGIDRNSKDLPYDTYYLIEYFESDWQKLTGYFLLVSDITSPWQREISELIAEFCTDLRMILIRLLGHWAYNKPRPKLVDISDLIEDITESNFKDSSWMQNRLRRHILGILDNFQENCLAILKEKGFKPPIGLSNFGPEDNLPEIG